MLFMSTFLRLLKKLVDLFIRILNLGLLIIGLPLSLKPHYMISYLGSSSLWTALTYRLSLTTLAGIYGAITTSRITILHSGAHFLLHLHSTLLPHKITHHSAQMATEVIGVLEEDHTGRQLRSSTQAVLERRLSTHAIFVPSITTEQGMRL